MIARKCSRLKHFGLNLFAASVLSSEKFGILAGLPNLCSVYIHSYSESSFVPIQVLFNELSRKGQLQYFDTNVDLFARDVCQALVQCRNLTQFFCGRVKAQDLLFATLEKIHEGKQLPAKDGRILHTNFGYHGKENFLHYPWVRFYEYPGDFPPSKVREQIWLAGVSDKPYNLDSLGQQQNHFEAMYCCTLLVNWFQDLA